MSAKGCKAWVLLPQDASLLFLAVVCQSQGCFPEDVVLTFAQTELVTTQGSLVFNSVLSGDLGLICNTYHCLF